MSKGAGGGGGVRKGKYFLFFSNKLSCPVRKKIWVVSILLTIIIIIILSINNAPTFNVCYFFRNQEKASTPLLHRVTGEPAVTHPYMSMKCLLLNTRQMGNSLALKIR